MIFPPHHAQTWPAYQNTHQSDNHGGDILRVSITLFFCFMLSLLFSDMRTHVDGKRQNESDPLMPRGSQKNVLKEGFCTY